MNVKIASKAGQKVTATCVFSGQDIPVGADDCVIYAMISLFQPGSANHSPALSRHLTPEPEMDAGPVVKDTTGEFGGAEIVGTESSPLASITQAM